MYVESPARWGYAITMESEKAKYQQMIVKCEQMRDKYEQMKDKYEQIIAKYQHTKATYEQLYAKYEQICAKHEQTCEYKTYLNDQRSKNKTEFNGQGTFQKIPTNKPANTSVLHPDEMNCRISRATLVCRFHSRKKREREPSRIPYRKVIKLFRKARIIRHAARSYLLKCIPNSSKLKLMLSVYNRYHFTEWFARSKCELSSRKYFVRQNLYFAVVRLRTLKHQNSPLFCMYVDERMLKQLKHCQVQTYHVAHRIICLSGDVETNAMQLISQENMVPQLSIQFHCSKPGCQN